MADIKIYVYVLLYICDKLVSALSISGSTKNFRLQMDRDDRHKSIKNIIKIYHYIMFNTPLFCPSSTF